MARYLKLPIALIALAVLFVGCDSGLADLDVENQNDPTRNASLQTGSDLESLLSGATTSTMQVTVSDWGPHMDLLADQITTTNAFRSFWDFAEEPRLQLNNQPTYATPTIFTDPWSNLNSGQAGANEILRITDVDGESITLEDGTDITPKMRAGAYFIRGIARGYLGMIYNQAYLVDAQTNPLEIDPTNIEEVRVGYADMISAAVADLEQAISIAGQNDFTWDLLLGNSYSSGELQQIAHSFAARFLMAEARTQQEALNYSTERLDAIISHADQGVGNGSGLPSFSPVSTSGDFYNQNADWGTFVISGPAGYIPADLKISHLLDPSYPVTYPTASGEVLPPHETDDPRSAYFLYTEAFGFLSSARNRSIFSNYFRWRTEAGNAWASRGGDPVVIVTGSEMQYLKAEANLLKGQKGPAATALENSPFGSVPTEITADLPSVQGASFFGSFPTALFPDAADGPTNSLAAGKTISPSASDAAFIRALHTEYSVELDLMGGIGLQWYFMRRHDLLQPGTALHYPIPGEELEITATDYYTFGGVDNAGQDGTASGANNWKTFDEENGLAPQPGVESKSAITQPLLKANGLDVEVRTPYRAVQQ